MMRKGDSQFHFVEAAYPIEKLKIYGNGCYEIVRKSLIKGPSPFENCTRGVIKKMTNKSISRLIVTAQATSVDFNSMLTLTYPRIFPHDGTTVKADTGFITQWLKKTYGTEYLWFLEFQARGAPHLHILLENDGITPRMRARVALKWTERVVTSDWFEFRIASLEGIKPVAATTTWRMVSVHVHQDTWQLLRDKDGARRYVTKYAAKAYQKAVPKRFQDVGRFWGCSQGVKPDTLHEIDVTDQEVRDFLREHEHIAANWEAIPKYIFNVNGA